jgi:hypothetical protein
VKRAFLPIILIVIFVGCTSAGKTGPPPTKVSNESKAPRNSVTVIHVFVALCDNVNQGIVPVSASLGNGDDPERNLYWGAAFGVKTFFGKSRDWLPVKTESISNKFPKYILDRRIFKHRSQQAFIVAEAYRGIQIKRATEDFLGAAAGIPGEVVNVSVDGKTLRLNLGGSADLVAYIGHDGLMDFKLTSFPTKQDGEKRDAIILACASQGYFAEALRKTGANPLLWTTNLMAPEAYILSAAIDGWLRKETDEEIRVRAAKAYDKYQKCGVKSANRLFATGW